MDSDSLELPAYSPREGLPSPPLGAGPRDLVKHAYSLTNKQGKAWVTLNILSKARTAEALPRVLQGEPITGDIDLMLSEETPIKSISVSVVGELITDSFAHYMFAETTQVLWSAPAKGAPLTLQASGESSNDSRPFKGKLKGSFRLPFSLGLPETVQLADNTGELKSFYLPCSFSPRFSVVTINYRIYATISFSSLLRPDQSVGTQVSYTAKSKPGPASVARQLAYQEHSPLIGPDGDPEGWHTLTPIKIRGTAFSSHSVELTYTLSLAKPLSYARGSVIPLHLSVDCVDLQALDLLSVPNAPMIHLMRTLSLGYDVGGNVDGGGRVSSKKMDLSKAKPLKLITFKDMTERIQTASWWSLPDHDPTSTGRRELQGEIHLPPTLNATAHLGKHNYFYQVAMYPPEAAGFSSDTSNRLQSAPVEVCTTFADGPRPIAYSPPKYTDVVRVEEESATRYNTMSIGALFILIMTEMESHPRILKY